jgi:uncharacterized protein YbjT (DUF2867 family)
MMPVRLNLFPKVQVGHESRHARPPAISGESPSGDGSRATSTSAYIRSRGEGEAAVHGVFPGAVIICSAVMFAPDDDFLTTILRLLRLLPVYPMFGDGRTRLQPVYADDVAAAIAHILRQSETPHRIYELEARCGQSQGTSDRRSMWCVSAGQIDCRPRLTRCLRASPA